MEFKQQNELQTRTKTEYNAEMPNPTTKEISHLKLFLLIKDLSIYTPTRNIVVGLLFCRIPGSIKLIPCK